MNYNPVSDMSNLQTPVFYKQDLADPHSCVGYNKFAQPIAPAPLIRYNQMRHEL